MQFCGRLSFMFAIQIIIKTGKIYNNAKFYDIMLLTKENAEKEAGKIGKIEYQPFFGESHLQKNLRDWVVQR